MKIVSFVSSMNDQVLKLILSIQKQELGIETTAEEQPDLMSLKKSYQSGKGGFWVACIGEDEVVGTIGLVDIGHQTLALRKMYVHADYRGKEKGTAQKLLNKAMTHAKEKRLSRVLLGTVDSCQAAIGFYERNGFSEITKARLPTFFPNIGDDTKFFEFRIKN